MPRQPIKFSSQQLGDILLSAYQASRNAPLQTRQELLDGMLAQVMTAAPVTPEEAAITQRAVNAEMSL
jgi:hypothetical protein